MCSHTFVIGSTVLKASSRHPGGGPMPRRLARLSRLGVQAAVQHLVLLYRHTALKTMIGSIVMCSVQNSDMIRCFRS
jgi:hypothetical protein